MNIPCTEHSFCYAVLYNLMLLSVKSVAIVEKIHQHDTFQYILVVRDAVTELFNFL